ncbi:MAG: hypothetical protein RR654_11860, partial [Oscillospiraceae bacterium]
SNGTIDDSVDRANLQKEVTSLKAEINRIAESSHFNGIKLLDGSLGGTGISAPGATGAVSTMTYDYGAMTKNAYVGSTFTVDAYKEDGTKVSKTFEFVKDTAAKTEMDKGTKIGVVLGDTLDASMTALASAISGEGATGKSLVGALGATGGAAYTAATNKLVLTTVVPTTT